MGVYEWQNNPLVFLVDGDILDRSPKRLDRLRRALAMRGDAPYLGVVRPGSLALYELGLGSRPAKSSLVSAEWEERDTFAILGNLRPGIPSSRQRSIRGVVLRLLSEAIDRLKRDFNLDGNNAISLVGRALFTRFLADREILPLPLFERTEELFDTAA
ncbi:MAG: restriction endonuclease subunit M, partial [Alphaproteobacteria bacterium]|nr:restriction endonuclease subunit M [Alphaproteobacteria bacterium]